MTNQMQVLEFTGKSVTVNEIIKNSDAMEQNIENVLSNASENEVLLGKHWYEIAHTISWNLATRYHVSLSQVAGIIAALSPGVQWEKNVSDAMIVITGNESPNGRISTYNSNTRKAEYIAQSEENPLNALGGNKVRSFYINILHPDKNDEITLDRHASKVTTGSDDNYPDIKNVSQKVIDKGKYFVTGEIYQRIARKVGLYGHQLQAITWSTYKRIYSTKSDGRIILPDWLFEPLTRFGYTGSQDNYNDYLEALALARDHDNVILESTLDIG